MLDGTQQPDGATPCLGTYRIARPAPGVVVVELFGEHDLDTTPRLREVVFALLAAHDLLVLDLTPVEFIDSSVLLMIVQANRLAREGDATFRLVVDSNSLVHRMLELSNILELCDVVSTLEAALFG